MLYKKSRIILFIAFFVLSFPSMTKAEDIPTSNEWAKSFEGYLFGLGPISGKFYQLDKFGQL